jgi:hypothetical protein
VARCTLDGTELRAFDHARCRAELAVPVEQLRQICCCGEGWADGHSQLTTRAHQIALRFAAAIERNSAGRIKVGLYPAFPTISGRQPKSFFWRTPACHLKTEPPAALADRARAVNSPTESATLAVGSALISFSICA